MTSLGQMGAPQHPEEPLPLNKRAQKSGSFDRTWESRKPNTENRSAIKGRANGSSIAKNDVHINSLK